MADEEKTQDYYDAVAEDYYKQYQSENLQTLKGYPANYFRLQILVRELASQRLNSVYEVGVGEGTPLAVMSSMGYRVAGCDISEKMVEQSKKTFEAKGLSPSLIQWADIEDANTFANQLAEGQYDAAMALGVLPHVKKDNLMLKNVGMIVRQGGKVFIEFRNKLFSLFTFNRFTKEFILDDLLRGVSAEVRDHVAADLDKRVAIDLPPVRHTAGKDGPGYDLIRAKFHNPFELLETFEACGYRNMKLHWYHYHPAAPMHEAEIGAAFREEGMALEHEGTWRGYFLCSAGVIEAEKA